MAPERLGDEIQVVIHPDTLDHYQFLLSGEQCKASGMLIRNSDAVY